MKEWFGFLTAGWRPIKEYKAYTAGHYHDLHNLRHVRYVQRPMLSIGGQNSTKDGHVRQ